MELFTARICPFAQRTRLLLLEKGLACEHVEEDLKNKSACFVAVSPYGKVPALVHDGETIYESLIINEYLDEVFPHPRLMPASPLLRARTRIWSHYCDNYYIAATGALVANRDPAQHAPLKAKVLDNMRFVEKEGFAKLSGEGPYWLGSEPSLLDLAWYPFFERLPALAHYRGVAIPEDCPRLARWLAAMKTRASVRETARDGDFYVAHYAARAGEVMAA